MTLLHRDPRSGARRDNFRRGDSVAPWRRCTPFSRDRVPRGRMVFRTVFLGAEGERGGFCGLWENSRGKWGAGAAAACKAAREGAASPRVLRPRGGCTALSFKLWGRLDCGVNEGVTNQRSEVGINYANNHLAMGQMTVILLRTTSPGARLGTARSPGFPEAQGEGGSGSAASPSSISLPSARSQSSQGFHALLQLSRPPPGCAAAHL